MNKLAKKGMISRLDKIKQIVKPGSLPSIREERLLWPAKRISRCPKGECNIKEVCKQTKHGWIEEFHQVSVTRHGAPVNPCGLLYMRTIYMHLKWCHDATKCPYLKDRINTQL